MADYQNTKRKFEEELDNLYTFEWEKDEVRDLILKYFPIKVCRGINKKGCIEAPFFEEYKRRGK